MNKGETALLGKVNEVLTATKKSGELNAIVQKWLNVPLPAKMASRGGARRPKSKHMLCCRAHRLSRAKIRFHRQV